MHDLIGQRRMYDFIDRRLVKDKFAIEEIEKLDDQIIEYAKDYNLKGNNIPKVIGSTDEDAWIETRYYIAWGDPLEKWNNSNPENFENFDFKENYEIGSIERFQFLEGKKYTKSEITKNALLIGRYRELKKAGQDPSTFPAWSLAACSFTARLIRQKLTAENQFVPDKMFEETKPFIKLPMSSEWTAILSDETTHIVGSIALPEAVRESISHYSGKPLSSLIEGEEFDDIEIISCHCEENISDDQSVSLTIIIPYKIERIGKAPRGIEQENPLMTWFDLAQN